MLSMQAFQVAEVADQAVAVDALGRKVHLCWRKLQLHSDDFSRTPFVC